MLTAQSNTQADRMAAKWKILVAGCRFEALTIKLLEGCSEQKLENNYSQTLLTLSTRRLIMTDGKYVAGTDCKLRFRRLPKEGSSKIDAGRI